MTDLALNGGSPTRTTPFPSWPKFDETDERALAGVLHSGRWGMADRIDEFEAAFAAYQEAEYGISLNSGTTALQVALSAVGVGPGDEVIVPSYTFVATASAVAAVGGVPIFVDVLDDTYNIDPASVQEALTERTRAVIAVHIGGQPADLDALGELLADRDIALIEDAAQAHGAAWKGRKIGAIGDLGTFSFQASKNLTAGEGGAVISNNRELADRAWSHHNCGRSRTGAWYEHPRLGSNYRMSEFHAALLLSQLEHLDEQMATRTRNAQLLTSLLAGIEGLTPLKADERVTTHAYHLYVLRFDSERFGGVDRERFIEALNAEGVLCSSGYRPLYREAAFTNSFADYPLETPYFSGKPDYSRFECPVTERICAEESVWLTQNLLLGEEADTRDIANAIAKTREHAHTL
jgi:dTDP-4-amino-4,6-dideoxygalactose transaminase